MKNFIENTHSLSVRDFDLDPYTDSVEISEQRIKLAWKPYKFGIWSWFLCPDCGRRCLHLYYKDAWWACRKCHKLYYRSQWMSKDKRLSKEYLELLPLLETGKRKWQHNRTHNKNMSRLSALQEILINSTLQLVYRNKQRYLRGINNRTIREVEIRRVEHLY